MMTVILHFSILARGLGRPLELELGCQVFFFVERWDRRGVWTEEGGGVKPSPGRGQRGDVSLIFMDDGWMRRRSHIAVFRFFLKTITNRQQAEDIVCNMVWPL